MQADAAAKDVLRVWIANKRQHSTIRIAEWEDPAVWGLLLADLANHLAKAYERDMEFDPQASLERIHQAFNEKLGNR